MTEFHNEEFDALVVGGGFYGASIALHLKREFGLQRVLVAERGPRLLGRASYGNQARVHQGYHYPRDFTTAYRSAANFRRFVDRYRGCVVDDFRKLYAVSRRGSKVTARQFQNMMEEIGAPCSLAGRRDTSLFSPNLIEAVFDTQEFAFDADLLAGMVGDDLRSAGVEVRLETDVVSVKRGQGRVSAILKISGSRVEVIAKNVFNCTYGRLSRLPGAGNVGNCLKYEIAELCLVEVPDVLRDIGVTVMDGPFFSCMPFPARGMHSLSHVSYTPHLSWTDATRPGEDPYEILAAYPKDSNFDFMVGDASNFLPVISGAKHLDSIFEIKVVLTANEGDDGRPILVSGDASPGGVVSVLGGKVDNIFDVLASLDARLRRN